jgi:arylsulfatase A-like enzyme
MPVFMVRMPGGVTASSNELAQPADVMPTILDFMKVTPPKTMHGRSLLGVLKGQKISIRDSALTAHFEADAQISDRRWLYGIWPPHGPKLYDRKTDPDQKKNVVRKNPSVAKRLHRKLISERKRLDAPADWVDKLDSVGPKR